MSISTSEGWITETGYRRFRVYGSPYHPDGAQVYEHVHVMEMALGRALKSSEAVHHHNGDKLDNRRRNLSVVPFPRHNRRHASEFKRRANGQLKPKPKK
jgi:hypothetical protein